MQLDAKWGFLAKGSLQPGILEGLDPLVKKSPLFMVKNGTSLFYSGTHVSMHGTVVNCFVTIL